MSLNGIEAKLLQMFLQPIFKRAVRIGIVSKFDNKVQNPVEHVILKKFMNIPLFPHGKFVEGIKFLKKEVERLVEDFKRRAKWDEMFGYVDREWIKIVLSIN